MKVFKKRSVMPASAKALADWHERPGAFQRLTPPWERLTLLTEPERIEDGALAEIKMSLGPVGMRWIAEHRDCQPGKSFIDIQTKGPFAHWEHHHRFLGRADGEGSELEDEVRYALPGAWLGSLLAGKSVEKRLRRTFAYRHAVTAMDLERLAHEPENVGGLKTVLISGATGMVGRALEGYLRQRGMKVFRLTRRPRKANDCYWNPARDELQWPSERIDAVVHLAGENIASGRWTEKRKRRLLESRRQGTRLLCERLASLDERPHVLVSASGVNYYAMGTEDPQDETQEPGSGFLTDVCEAWEEEAGEAAKAGIRTVRMRLGLVLSPSGGALAKMLPAFKLGLGGRLGSGRQRMPWVALDDVIDLMHRAIVDERYEGALNVVAPQVIDNALFTRTLAAVLGRPAFLNVPAFVLEKGLGQMARETLLADLHVAPVALQELAYPFRFSDLKGALQFMLPAGQAP